MGSKDDLNRVLNYIKNPDKTKEDMSDGLKEVLTYTTQGYKTNEKSLLPESIVNLVRP